jgi:MFS family permease
MDAVTDPAGAHVALPRNVRVVAGVSFLQDTASEMLYPVLPLFVVGLLAAPPAALGIIEGVAETTAAVAKVGAGVRADRVRRRPMIGAGYTLSAFAKPAVGLAIAWPMVLAARMADRLGKGIRGAPRDALIADETTPANRGRAFGFHRAADTAGAVIGPLLGLALYFLVGERLRPLFFLAFIPAIASAALVLLVRERPHPRPVAGAAPFDPRRLGAHYWRATAPLIVFACVNFTDALVLLRADELGLGFTGVVLAYVLYNVVYSALSYPAGRWSDRRPRPQVFALGLVVFAVAYTGLGLATSAAWVWVLLPVYGAFTALTDGVGKAWISDVVPAELRATGLGTYGAASGLGMLVAGLWAGLAWGDDGSLPFLVAGPLALVVAAVVAVRRR